MVRMLFLRDIDGDVLIRCRACGHSGVLPHARMERMFGPSYPVLSIAPHFRCSRCDSRDTESLPAPPQPIAEPAREPDATPFARPEPARQVLDAAAIAALLGITPAEAVQDDDSRGAAEEPEPPEPVTSDDTDEFCQPEPDARFDSVPDNREADPPVEDHVPDMSRLFAFLSEASDGAEEPEEEPGTVPEPEPDDDDIPLPSFAIRDPERDGPDPSIHSAMAILRDLVVEAAAQPEPEPSWPSPPPPADLPPEPFPQAPEPVSESPEPSPEAEKPAASSDSFEITLSKLRALLDLDADGSPSDRGGRLFRRR